MNQTINYTLLRAAIERVVQRVIELTDELNRLDAALGDGDTGITVSKGARGVLAYLETVSTGDDLGQWLAGLGMAFNRAAPSTMGALVATAFMRAGKEAKGQTQLEPALLARMFEAANKGIQERGGAKPGDKTLVDALDPAAQSFSKALTEGMSLQQAGMYAIEAARAGRDAATPLRSQKGRANWVGERTEGKPDPGCVLVVAVLEAVFQESKC